MKVIVTGGTYGIGASVVSALAASGATVATMARGAERGRAHADDVTARGGGEVRFFTCDVSQRRDVGDAFGAATGWLGGLDALVHVAGVENGGRPEAITDADWDHVFDVNAKGTMLTNQAAFEHLRDAGGTIVNFGSGAGVQGLAGNAAYAASKGAVAAWTRSVAMAWGRHGITVNMVCPAVKSPMYTEHRARLTPDELRAHDARMAERIVIGGELGDADRDVAPVVLFLVSSAARFMTGQTIAVDGGAMMVR